MKAYQFLSLILFAFVLILVGFRPGFNLQALAAFETPYHSHPVQMLSSHIPALIQHTLETPNGTQHYTLRTKVNELGELELSVEHDEIRFFLPDTHIQILVGRDLDNDRIFDAWFLLGKSGVDKIYDQKASSQDGWDVISQILQKNPSTQKNRWLVGILYDWAMNFSQFWAIHDHELLQNLEKRQINLHDLEIRTDRIAAINILNPIAQKNYALMSAAWEEASADINHYLITRWGYVALDATLAISANIFFKKMSPLLSQLETRLSQAQFGEFMNQLHAEYFKNALFNAGRAAARVVSKLPKPITKALYAMKAVKSHNKIATSEKVNQAIQYLNAREQAH